MRQPKSPELGIRNSINFFVAHHLFFFFAGRLSLAYIANNWNNYSSCSRPTTMSTPSCLTCYRSLFTRIARQYLNHMKKRNPNLIDGAKKAAKMENHLSHTLITFLAYYAKCYCLHMKTAANVRRVRAMGHR